MKASAIDETVLFLESDFNIRSREQVLLLFVGTVSARSSFVLIPVAISTFFPRNERYRRFPKVNEGGA